MGWFGNFAQGISRVAGDITAGQQQIAQQKYQQQQLDLARQQQQLQQLNYQMNLQKLQQEMQQQNELQKFYADPAGYLKNNAAGVQFTPEEIQDFVLRAKGAQLGFSIPATPRQPQITPNDIAGAMMAADPDIQNFMKNPNSPGLFDKAISAYQRIIEAGSKTPAGVLDSPAKLEAYYYQQAHDPQNTPEQRQQFQKLYDGLQKAKPSTSEFGIFASSPEEANKPGAQIAADYNTMKSNITNQALLRTIGGSIGLDAYNAAVDAGTINQSTQPELVGLAASRKAFLGTIGLTPEQAYDQEQRTGVAIEPGVQPAAGPRTPSPVGAPPPAVAPTAPTPGTPAAAAPPPATAPRLGSQAQAEVEKAQTELDTAVNRMLTTESEDARTSKYYSHAERKDMDKTLANARAAVEAKRQQAIKVMQRYNQPIPQEWNAPPYTTGSQLQPGEQFVEPPKPQGQNQATSPPSQQYMNRQSGTPQNPGNLTVAELMSLPDKGVVDALLAPPSGYDKAVIMQSGLIWGLKNGQWTRLNTSVFAPQGSSNAGQQ